MPDLGSIELALQEQAGEECTVCVAVHIRPLVVSELEQGSQSCLSVTPGQPQIAIHQHNFTYDHVFGGDCGSMPSQLYPRCVAPLVEGLFKGYNATVFAYGQTGSGKTYTMGSEYRPGSRHTSGVIPEAISAIFQKIAQAKDWQCSLRVSFVEIHKEEVRDLLVSHHGPRPAVTIREVMGGGGVCLFGAIEKEVRSQDEMAELLEMGTLCRATASTNMNNRSSRSHAIFTITLEQRRQESAGGSSSPNNRGGGDDDDDDNDGVAPPDGGDGDDSYLCAKMHLVDLAGSERQKRTKAEGQRLKEGIHINRGLLALGNVINAIVDNHKHVPYRDSKLTRLLQDSLGGNSRTVMIACVSPADINYEESLNTLRYADRARHIRNKPTINRDPVAAQVAFFRQQIAVLRGENRALKAALAAEGKSLAAGEDGDGIMGPAGGQHWAVVDTLQQENTVLELDNARLKIQLEQTTRELETIKQKSYLVQASLDRTTAELQLLKGTVSDATAVRPTGGVLGAATTNAHDMVVATYVARVAELEKELRATRALHNLRRRHTHNSQRAAGGDEDGHGASGAGELPKTPGGAGSAGVSTGGMLTPISGGGIGPFSPEEGLGTDAEGTSMGALAEGPEETEGRETMAEEEMYYAEMAAHALEQEKMKHEMAALQRLLESKEKRMAELQSGSGQVPALKQHYDRVLADLQKERDSLMQEKVTIMQKLQHLQVANEEERKRLEAAYKEKLAAADDKLKALRHKEREFVSMQKLKQRTEDMCRRLSTDINRIKQQKVQLQKMMEQSAKQFAQWRQDREKELAQLRKQARRSAAQIQALEAMQAKQNAVLQRKIADANAARKKLRELQAGSGPDRSHHHGGGGVRDSLNSRSGGLSSADAPLEARLRETDGVQPNSNAPLLRTESDRTNWIVKEVDLCCRSYEYSKVIEGELAQRAEVTRQLRNLVKRVMIVDKLEPASPLVAAPNGCPPTPCGPNQVGDAVISQLLERKAYLEMKLEDHSMQITELQKAWEHAKNDEETRGAGAADVKRWNMVRNIVECRQLLKTTFKEACRIKREWHTYYLDNGKLREEILLLNAQLDAARKEAVAQRKRASAIEATAASAIATPYLGASSVVHRADDTDREVDDLLQQLQLAKTPSLMPQEDDNGSKIIEPVRFSSIEDEVVQLGSPDGSVEVSVDPPLRSSGRVVGTVDALQAHIKSRPGMSRRTADLEPFMRHSGQPLDCDGSESSDDTDDMDVDEDEDQSTDEDEWDPSQATPHRGHTTRRHSRSIGRPFSGNAHSSGTHPMESSGPAAAAGRRRSRGTSASGAACADEVVMTGRLMGNAGWGGSSTVSRSEAVPVRRSAMLQSQAYKQDQLDYPGPTEEEESWVHVDINMQRVARGLPEEKRLTIAALKEALKGKVMPDGKPWRAGSKTKSELVKNYLRIAEADQGGTPLIISTQGHTLASSRNNPLDRGVSHDGPDAPGASGHSSAAASAAEPSLGASWPSLSGRPPTITRNTAPHPIALPPEPLMPDSAFASTGGVRAKFVSHDGMHLHAPRDCCENDNDGHVGMCQRPFMAGISPGSPRTSGRDYRAAILSPGSAMRLRTQLSHDTPLGCASPTGVDAGQARLGSAGYSVPLVSMSHVNGGGYGGGNGPSSVRASLAALGMSHLAPQASPSPRVSSAESPLQAGNVTPMSMLYIQKAKEARARMNDIKQFIPRNNNVTTPGRMGTSSPSPLPPHMTGTGVVGLSLSNGNISGTAAAAAVARQLSGRSSPASSQNTPRREGRTSPSQRAPSSGRARAGVWK